MPIDTLASWLQVVKKQDVKGLDTLLAEQVVFHSPVVHTPQIGKAITTQYLAAAFRIFFNETFCYQRQISSSQDAMLEFQVEIEGIVVNGVDLIKWDQSGKITELKVMIRPLKAINLIHQKMAAMLRETEGK